MDNIDGLVTKDDVYRLLSDFRIYIPADIRHQMIEKVKALPSVDVGSGDWISVKDRMPEMNRDVIGFCASKEPELFDGVTEIVYLKDTINFLGEHKVTPYWCCDVREFFRTNYEVTHWMPLPEPPKEE